ncbi:hypothetical protein P170DRAFT_434142 [Aspergillus steynii IBT 23096]|uniref:Exosome complex protein n=1 Tax=Aspergillus steynii IBT 23096 TaxID=1392250 RepID=A0A2I2GHL5_9EURO|nr:uncharacterized protein P170DRAFT_434142 [Aspergillus steynii IBT 23096]PLB52372.1 hypothetical protein P170DRAFT_434142 [Aspergillus steynii IBT 23096]
MDPTDLLPLVDQLDDDVDVLEEALAPLLNSAVTETSKKLPVMDKAKYHVMVTYALESLIFSYLRLHGVNAKDHPVFRELTRVKQYFAKIKALETEPEQRTMTLDKEAAGRFIKHGLAGNDKYDMERKEREAKEKARAQFKASLLAKKQGDAPQQSSENPTNGSESESESGSDDEMKIDEPKAETTAKQSKNTAKAAKPEQKKKNKQGKDKGEKKSKSKNKRSKEGRTEDKKERRNKKKEVRKD